jgi:hypothetical protein
MGDELKVPKRRAQVELLLPYGNGSRQVLVFLAEFAGSHAGHERLSDLLNGPNEFLPAVDLATDTMSFVGRAGIAAARVGKDWESSYGLGDAEEHEVEITLSDGTTLRGIVQFELPPDRSRLLDYLNDVQPFVRLDEGEKVVLVNKRHIARVAKVK